MLSHIKTDLTIDDLPTCVREAITGLLDGLEASERTRESYTQFRVERWAYLYSCWHTWDDKRHIIHERKRYLTGVLSADRVLPSPERVMINYLLEEKGEDDER